MPLTQATLTIDLDALVHNYKTLAQIAAPARCAAAVKADAYGLGMQEIVPALRDAGCNEFFVATLEEAITLRSITPVSYTHLTLPTSLAG